MLNWFVTPECVKLEPMLECTEVRKYVIQVKAAIVEKNNVLIFVT